MTGRMLAELGWVAHNEAERIGIRDDQDLTEGQKEREYHRLMAVASRFFYMARERGFVQSGTDYVFGDKE